METHPRSVEISRMVSFSQGIACIRTLNRLFSTLAQYVVEQSIPQVVMIINQDFLVKLQKIGLTIFDPLPGTAPRKGTISFPPHQINLEAMRTYFRC
ncbi:MAG: hypothetical protein WAT81_01810 [Candidatus Moraniibacteriota bacterium]